MKFAKRTLSVLLAVLMLVSLLPLSVFAATLKITTQPKTSYTEYGATAKATIKATGDGLKYTWYVKNAGASKYSKSSITKSTYSVKMTDSVKSRSVYCVVKDKKGNSVKSSTAILRMKATITTEPKTTYAQLGATAKLTVKAKGDGLKYTWYIKNAGKTKYSKSSVTKSTYSVTMSDSVHGRYAYCIVTDKYGKTDKSKTVVLRRSATITTEPTSVTVKKGEIAKATVKAKGDGLKYQWYVKNVGETKYSKSSITGSTYSVKMRDSVHGRYVYCIVTDKYGKTDKSKTVVLKQKADPLVIVTQPKDVVASAGQKVSFTVAVSGGKAPYGYQWEVINDDEDEWRDLDDKYDGGWAKGYETATLTVNVGEADFTNNERYRCRIWEENGSGYVVSNVVKVIKKENPFVIVTQPENQYANVGEEVRFFVEVEGGKGPYTYQWQKMDKFDEDWKNKSGETYASLYITVDEEEFEYEPVYRCVITDANGEKKISKFVSVIERTPVVFTKQPESVYCWEDCQVSFSVTVSGGVAPYTYHWEYIYDGAQSWSKIDYDEPFYNIITGANTFAKNYRYRCIVTDAEGTQAISHEARAIQHVPLTIIYQSQTVACAVGSSAALTFAVNGAEPLTYQWQKMDKFDEDWKDIKPSNTGYTGCQTGVLVVFVSEEEFEYEPVYRCVVTDPLGNQVISNNMWIEEKP